MPGEMEEGHRSAHRTATPKGDGMSILIDPSSK